ncbi:hypothetical protein GGI35DRAFT_55975 [Trichoderma velutinum]
MPCSRASRNASVCMKMLRLLEDSPHPIGLGYLSRLCRLSDAVLCRYRSKTKSSVLQLNNMPLRILSMTHITRIPFLLLMLVRVYPVINHSVTHKRTKKRKSSHQFEANDSNSKKKNCKMANSSLTGSSEARRLKMAARCLHSSYSLFYHFDSPEQGPVLRPKLTWPLYRYGGKYAILSAWKLFACVLVVGSVDDCITIGELPIAYCFGDDRQF